MLWNKFRAGDLHALEVIYRAHFKELYQYGMTIYPHVDVVKDAIQELFTSLVQRQHTLTSVQNVSFYLIKSLRNRIYDELKNRKKAEMANEDFKKEELVNLVGEEFKFSEDFKNQRKDQLVNVINQLPDRQREIIMLIFFEGRSYEEVSKLMSMTVNSAYKLTWKAVNTLKKNLKQLK